MLSIFFFTWKSCIVIVNKIDLISNNKINNINYTLYNDGVHATLFNFSIEFLTEIQKMMIGVKVNLPDSESDQSYRREYFRTTIDLQKLLNGVFVSFFMRSFMENFYSSINFVPQLPIKKVIFSLILV